MFIHLPTLLGACAMTTALLAAAMTLFGATQRIYRGFWWWAAAQWLLSAGLVLQTLGVSEPKWSHAATLLLLQWPVVVLAGTRRFFTRSSLALPPMADWLALGLASFAWLAAWALQPGDTRPATSHTAFAAAALALHLYAAWLLNPLRKEAKSPALTCLVAVLAGMAFAHGLCLAATLGAAPSPLAGSSLAATGLVSLPAALAALCVGLLLTHERTEGKLRESHQKLRFLADIDMLTRVPNRRHFHELAAATLAASAEDTCCVMMFDIDHFKQVNDLLGHANGDEALRQVALAVRETLRERDVAGRLGGDEFAALLPQTSLSDAMSVAGRIVDRLEHRQVAPRVARLSLSFGVVQLQPGEDVNAALRRADQALYEAKRQGRSRAVIATGEEDKPVFGESRPMGLSSPL